jgi:hypothetical protein
MFENGVADSTIVAVRAPAEQTVVCRTIDIGTERLFGTSDVGLDQIGNSLDEYLRAEHVDVPTALLDV